MTVKRDNVGQSEVTNTGQIGNQQMFVLCDRMGKEWGAGTYSSTNESPDVGRKKMKAK